MALRVLGEKKFECQNDLLRKVVKTAGRMIIKVFQSFVCFNGIQELNPCHIPIFVTRNNTEKLSSIIHVYTQLVNLYNILYSKQ